MAAGKWVEGVSRTSIGRFGGMHEDAVPYNNGYLTASATATRVYLELDYERVVELGHYQVPRDFSLKTDTSWVAARYTFQTGDGKPHSVLTRSVLFPGFHHRIRSGLFEYYWRIKNYGATDLVLPLKGGFRHVHGTSGYDRKRDGDLARPWVLFYFSDSGMPFDYPMQLTFDRHPERIEVWTHEYLKIHFRTKNATVVQVHPFGAERLDKGRTARWKAGLPEELLKKLDFWAAAALAYPAGCREDFRVDERRGVVQIRNQFRCLESKSEWGVKPIHLAPLPPVLANARHEGYPVKVKGRLLTELCPTFFGWYEAVKGRSIEYEIPLSRFRGHTLAPVTVRNSPEADAVTTKLTEYLEAGDYLTFGGDDHYDAECSLDSLHDLRTMAWSAWSIPEDRREHVFRLLTRGLKNFDEDDFLEFETPVTGTKWARHKTIFDYRGVIDYDMEWYNGMNLAGLWAYDYYGPEGEGLRLARKHWPLIRKIFAYFKAYTDWALGVAWTCCRGEGCWLDGVNYAYEGLLGFAALARKLGKTKDAEWGDYLAAKTEAFVWHAWQGGGYFRRFFPQGEVEPLVVSGWHEGRPARYGRPAGWSCGVLSYLVREVLVLLEDLHKEQVLKDAMLSFAGNFPDWRRDPYGYGKGTGYPGSDPRRTIHHYSLDPRLMVCALVLDEPLASLMDVGVTLTAPVLECCLVSCAPKLLVPRDARFLGAAWDTAARTLTVQLAGKGKFTLGFAHSEEPTCVGAKVLKKDVTEGRVFYTVKLDGETEVTFQF
ncbi:MAG: hypothetical protein AMK75_01940 [Planctomycetes bacterium SM23_65]|nr:MAG: hypothetical protein AMK75_01940 [Planctomycetes bacterium SM23_65]